MPAPTDPCAGLFGPGLLACQLANHIVGGVTGAVSFASDPLGFVAKACASATVWVWGELAKAIDATSRVDFTNAGFLQVYALVFAASSVLVALLWLFAVIRRVVRGVPAGQAIGEAIGLLWLSVLAAALAPAVLVLLMGLVGTATGGLAAGLGGGSTKFLTGAGKALDTVGTPGSGGAVVLILGSVLGLIVGVIVWVELLIAGAALYVAGVFAPLVLAGLVDRSLWRHTSRYAGVVVALALVKPVLVVVFGIAAALASSGTAATGFASVLTACALMALAVFVSYAVYRFVPVVGEDLGQLHGARRAASNSGPAAAIPGPATIAQQGIRAHMGGGSGGSSGGGAAARPTGGSGPRTGAEHMTRTPPATPPPPPPAPAPASAPTAASAPSGGKA